MISEFSYLFSTGIKICKIHVLKNAVNNAIKVLVDTI